MLGTPELLLTFWEPKLFLVELHCSKNLSGTLTRFQAFWLPGVPTSAAAAAAAKSVQSCLTLCDPTDGSPAGSAIPGILQARTLEWVALTFSNAWKWKVKVKSLSRVRLFATHGLQPTRLLRPWDSPGKSTGVGCHWLEQFQSASVSG